MVREWKRRPETFTGPPLPSSVDPETQGRKPQVEAGFPLWRTKKWRSRVAEKLDRGTQQVA